MSMLKDCYLLCFVLIFTIYLVIRCQYLKNEILSQKKSFIEILEHDLRVPVIAQIRGLDLIRKNLILPDNQYYLLDEVYTSNIYTLDMINMLIKIYGIECGDIKLNYEEFSAYETFEVVLKGYEDAVSDKDLKIMCNMDEAIFCADKETMHKALKILLYLVLQHSRTDSELKFSIGSMHNRLHLTLTYTGRNLSFEEYQRIFSYNPNFSAVGHGIQMYLFKKIIDLHKGKIEMFYDNNNETYSVMISLPQNKKASWQRFWRMMRYSRSLSSLQNLI